MSEEENLQKLLSGEDLSNVTVSDDVTINKSDNNLLVLDFEAIDTSLLTEEQQGLEAELALFPGDDTLWHQLIQTIKVLSPNFSYSSSKNKGGAAALQDRAWKDKYLRNVYRRMLTGGFKFMAWLWVEYLLFEASLIGLQLPSATLLPMPKKSSTPSPPLPDTTFLEKAFECALDVCFSSNVWILYLNFLKKKASVSGEEMEPTQEKQKMIQVYEAALSKVDMDIYSGPIWADYIGYLKSEKTDGLFEEQVKMDQLRKVYQRALLMPHTHLEALWREYDAFENQLNKVTAKKILNEKSGLYMNARVGFKELKTKMDFIHRNKLEGKGNKIVTEQENMWKKVFEWEKSNALKLEDTALVVKRQEYTFRAALSPLCQSATIWLYYALFKKKQEKATTQGKGQQTMIQVLNEAAEMLPMDLVVVFTLADTLETGGLREEGKVVYDKLLDLQHATLKGAEELLAKRRSLLLEAEKMSDKESLDSLDMLMASIDDLEGRVRCIERENNMTYIQTMRFMRRTGGVIAARSYFGRARKVAHCSPLVYLASAQMEYFVAKEPLIAFKIFELGMKKFATSNILEKAPSNNIKETPPSVLPLDNDTVASSIELFDYFYEYCRLLLLQMDDTNALALFERLFKLYITPTTEVGANQGTTTKAFAARLIPILDLLLEHEKNFGGQNSLMTQSSFIEKRHYLVTLNECPMLEDDPVQMMAEKSSFYSLSIKRNSPVPSNALPGSSYGQVNANISTSARKRFLMTDVDLQPFIPAAKKANSLAHLPPAIQDVLQLLGDTCYDLPAIHIDVLMNALASLTVPSVLIPKNPPLHKRNL